MASWLDLLMGGQAPQFPQGQQPPAPPFVPQRMAIAPTFAQAPQMAQDIAAGIADPLLKAGNYLGGIMQGSQQFSWPETIQHGAALAMALAPGPGRAGEAAGALERGAAGLAKGAAEIAPTGISGGIRAYHGSPYDFPAFDLSKIGTGEGAQAYGHGLYFAENEATAKAYRDALGLNNKQWTVDGEVVGQYGQNGTPLGGAAARVRQAMGDDGVVSQAHIDVAKQKLAEVAGKNPGLIPNVPAQMSAMDSLLGKKVAEKNVGKMYEVNIRAQPEQFLDFDRPFGEQSPAVQKAITDLWTARGGTLEGRTKPPFVASTDTGEAIHAALATTYGQGASKLPRYGNDAAAAAQALRDAGIPGIRYLDQGSRADATALETLKSSLDSVKSGGQRPFETAEQYNSRLAQAESDLARAKNPTRNYVVFNDKLIDILRKYGLIGALGGSMSAPYFAPQGQQQ